MIQVSLAIGGLVVLAVGYLLAMRLALPVSKVDTKAGADHRDLVYAILHAGGLLVALIAGFALGKWLSGLGIAWALLFVTAIVVVMVGAQLGSHELACQGHNDLIRHWAC